MSLRRNTAVVLGVGFLVIACSGGNAAVDGYCDKSSKCKGSDRTTCIKNVSANRDDAFKVMQDFLTRFKQIDAVWAADDDMAVGVLKAIDQAKRKDIKIVFGGAGAKGMVKTLIDGKDPRIQANVSYSPKFMYDAIKLTAEARLKGEKLPPTTIIPSVLITKENAKDFYFPNSPF